LTLERAPRSTFTGMGITVSQLADLSGVATDTLRYWEKAGLLAPPTRNANGYRSYEPVADRGISPVSITEIPQLIGAGFGWCEG
jgi:hypothetical protein